MPALLALTILIAELVEVVGLHWSTRGLRVVG
jgi:hypothetical protein